MNHHLGYYINIEPDFFQEPEGELGIKMTGKPAIFLVSAAGTIFTLKNPNLPLFVPLDTVIIWLSCPVEACIPADRKEGWSPVCFMGWIFPRIHRGGCAV